MVGLSQNTNFNAIGFEKIAKQFPLFVVFVDGFDRRYCRHLIDGFADISEITSPNTRRF